MRFGNLVKWTLALALVPPLLTAVGLRTTNAARTQDDRDHPQRRGRNWDGYRNYGGSAQLRQTALNAGYNEGVKKGREDKKKRRNYDFQGSSAYQKADKDYNSKLGDKEIYRRYFRDAFENGYSDGWRGY